MRIYPTFDQQMAAFMAELCSCGAPREQHEQTDGSTWGICVATDCQAFELADDFIAGFDEAEQPHPGR